MMKTLFLSIQLVFLSVIISFQLNAQGYEYGDAPENVLAYPSLGVNGQFPTCITVGSSYVRHGNFGAVLGPTFDFEVDGNGGLCPGFAPYDNDECFADGDAGLLIPEAYTIVNNVVVTCPNSNGTSLGMTCTAATWGGNVDILVANNMPSQTPGFMNVVFDFNQNGVWGDMVTCPAGPVPEHVLQNFIIPWGYSGPLSGLMPPGFTIGPNTGYVWARFTISEQPVGMNWDGHGFFEDGESEDYLIRIGDVAISDFGDAPEDALAYPSTGMIGSFPTCINVGNSGYIEHWHFAADLGPSVDYEMDGNAGLCPTFAPYDDDECFNDGDAGLLFPDPYTIAGGVVSTCPNSTGTSLGYPCDTAVWGSNVDIDVNNNMPSGMDAFMNVLIDWNKNGVWGDTVYCTDIMVPEHVLQNFPIPNGHVGALSGLLPPDFIIGPEEGYFWARFTISDLPVFVPWDGSGVFEDGETEDYLLRVDTAGIVYEVEYGDAPDGVIAYPSSAIIGNFPTCMNVPASGYVSHMNFGAVLGPMVDFENEGNAGICPGFNPYDNDECFNDGDAGLMFPDPFTIQGGVVVTCPGSAGTSIGFPCTQASWGINADIQVQNFMPGGATAYLNVLFDWTMNGAWGDIAACAGAIAVEHALQNFAIPNGYSGPLSALSPPGFVIGPTSGYVWARFTISESQVSANWDGQGSFEDGETEDYLLYIAPGIMEGDYGDAPEGVIGYPSTGILGNFPTCIGSGPANHYVEHLPGQVYFGPTVDYEVDGNAGLCSPYNLPYDNDECYQDNDAGLIIPAPFTIQVTGGIHAVVPCQGTGGMLDTICSFVHWGPELDIMVNNFDTLDVLVNVLMDFNQDGHWAPDTTMHCNGVTISEHVLHDFPVPAGYSGPLSALNPPAFIAGPNPGYIWTRFTISAHSVASDWDGVGNFDRGESEDYLLYLDIIEGIGKAKLPGADLNLQVYPNPTSNSCNISYKLDAASQVCIDVYDIRGSLIKKVFDANQNAGTQLVNWDGMNASGQPVNSGIYFIKVSLNNIPIDREKVMIIR